MTDRKAMDEAWAKEVAKNPHTAYNSWCRGYESALAQPEQESKPMYVMGNYAGEGKVVNASFGLPKGAFEFAPYTGKGEASKIKHSLEPMPEQAVVSFPSFMRKRIEQALKDAIHPTGMSVHDGKVKVLASDLHRMLLVIDSVLAQPEPQVCCGDYEKCMKACTPRGRWLAENELAQPEHPLDKKAANARKLGLDYEVEQEPVAWMYDINGTITAISKVLPPDDAYDEGTLTPMYTAPPKSEWVGLTDEDAANISMQSDVNNWRDEQVIDAVEAKLKEKNNAV